MFLSVGEASTARAHRTRVDTSAHQTPNANRNRGPDRFHQRECLRLRGVGPRFGLRLGAEPDLGSESRREVRRNNGLAEGRAEHPLDDLLATRVFGEIARGALFDCTVAGL